MSASAEKSIPVPLSGMSFWQLVRQALRGAQHDYTAVSLNWAVLLLAVPMVLEMVMESLFSVVDVFWVSRLVRWWRYGAAGSSGRGSGSCRRCSGNREVFASRSEKLTLC